MKRILSGSLAIIIIVGSILILNGAATAATACPAVGLDTDCGTVITLTNSGGSTSAAVTSTGQGPYDGNDDTLVGVVNNTTKPISALGLTSGNLTNGGIFAFDGDGISSSTYGLPGNAQDSTQYGGPNAYYTNISSDQTAGVVDFITPIAPGGTAYFSLENAISQAHSCAEVVNKSVSGPTISSGTQINATFTPNFGYTVSQAAVFCGVTDFDWQQTITTLPLPNPFLQAGNPKSLFAPPPFNDPPPGGYTYEGTPDNSYPFYYDPTSGELASHETSTTVSFSDAPADNCLPGGTGASCGGKTAPAGSIIAFTTHLVGVNADRSALDLGIGFNWTSNFNGTSGGISTTKNGNPTDPGSGTGGVTVGTVTTTTPYQYDGVVVTTVNGNSLCPCKIYLPVTANLAANGQLLQTSPVRPAAPQPTPTVFRRIPISGQSSR